jgi:hypothetical protein
VQINRPHRGVVHARDPTQGLVSLHPFSTAAPRLAFFDPLLLLPGPFARLIGLDFATLVLSNCSYSLPIWLHSPPMAVGKASLFASVCVRVRCAVLDNYFKFRFCRFWVGCRNVRCNRLGLIHFGGIFWEPIFELWAIPNSWDFGWQNCRPPARLASGPHSQFWQVCGFWRTKRRSWRRRGPETASSWDNRMERRGRL